MADRPDKDQLVRTPKPPSAPNMPSSGGLPVGEPQQRNPADDRADVERQIAELEGVLRYMGLVHPQRSATEQKLNALRTMLKQM